MPICASSTSGGKGNVGKFYERSPRVCAAGVPTGQEHDNIGNMFRQYLLQDETDALLSDTIIPEPKRKPLPPLRKPIPLDMRFAVYGNVAQLVNPKMKTKFQTLVSDMKETVYKSYWKKPLGRSRDPVPMLPDGFDVVETTLGKKNISHGRLYDIIMPKEPIPDKTPRCKEPGVQINRNYLQPAFNPDLTYGHRANVDKRGRLVKCALRDDEVFLGKSDYTLANTIRAHHLSRTQTKMGKTLTPNQNIKEVPKGYSFGKLKSPGFLPECLSYCDLNPERDFFKKCLGHLNSLRNILTTLFLPGFFNNFYLNLKYADKNKTGWLPKEEVYEFCGTKLIRFDPSLIEPLLSALNAFDGKSIEYKTFVHIINYKQPLTGFPKVADIPTECIDYRTTYGEMTKPGQETDERLMAGVSSGRYLDRDYPVTPEKCCKADNADLPQESDMKCIMNPSIMTRMNVSHRDMYAKRDESTIRKIFETSGETFTDDYFSEMYKKAQQYHPLGWVCYETFRRALTNQ